jgi:hypothetical protein
MWDPFSQIDRPVIVLSVAVGLEYAARFRLIELKSDYLFRQYVTELSSSFMQQKEMKSIALYPSAIYEDRPSESEPDCGSFRYIKGVIWQSSTGD